MQTMPPNVASLLQEITGKAPDNMKPPSEETLLNGPKITNQALEKAASFRELLENEDFLKKMTEDEIVARSKLGTLNANTCPEIDLRIALAIWQREVKRIPEMRDHIAWTQAALKEKLEVDKSAGNDKTAYHPD
jgi:hypothetical protein